MCKKQGICTVIRPESGQKTESEYEGGVSLKKKTGIWEEYKKEFLKSRKRSRKATYKLMNADAEVKKNIYKSVTKAPKRIERMIAFLFIVFVFVIFFIKAKDPTFLEYNITDKKS